LCGGLIDRVGVDVQGTLLPNCRKCKSLRAVKIACGKLTIEAELPLPPIAPENPRIAGE